MMNFAGKSWVFDEDGPGVLERLLQVSCTVSYC